MAGEAPAASSGQFFAQVFEQDIIVTLATDKGIIAFSLDTAATQAPGSFAVNAEPAALEGNWFSLTAPTGISNGSGGTIALSNCKNTVGAVLTGSFSGIGLVNPATGTTDGSFSGTFRAQIQTSDGSANCAPEPSGDTGTSDGGGGGGTCDADTENCTGPCCEYVEPFGQCVLSCVLGGNPADPEAIATCSASCESEVGITGDAACKPKWDAAWQCSEANNCSEREETPECNADNDCDPTEECTLEFCCSEFKAAFN